MNRIILNIELFVGVTDQPINALDAQAAVHAAFPSVPPFGIRATVLPNAQGRATLVAGFDLSNDGEIIDSCWNLCDALGQEAIALKINGVGHLFGPLAANWGSFDPAQFLSLPAGTGPLSAMAAFDVLRSFLPSDDVLGKAGLEACAVVEYHLSLIGA